MTRTELTITQPLKGGAADKGGSKMIVLEQMGGTYNGKTQRLLGDAKLSPGEDAVVFLRAGDKGRWHLTALALSAYHVDKEGHGAARPPRGCTSSGGPEPRSCPSRRPSRTSSPSRAS